jgi:circadian clock protein KaiB
MTKWRPAGETIAAVEEHFLRLYVAGDTPTSLRARENFASLCAEVGFQHFESMIVDILADPQAAEAARILATPTLVCDRGSTSRRIIGDLRERQRVLDFLGIKAEQEK